MAWAISSPRTSSHQETVQPPNAKPPPGSSSGPPGACMTPSRLMKVAALTLRMISLLLRGSGRVAELDVQGDGGPGEADDRGRFDRFAFGEADGRHFILTTRPQPGFHVLQALTAPEAQQDPPAFGAD